MPQLVLAMNRDEFTARPTAPLSWRAGLLGGWDLQPGREGGTWLAMDTGGRLGLLTNIYTGAALLMLYNLQYSDITLKEECWTSRLGEEAFWWWIG